MLTPEQKATKAEKRRLNKKPLTAEQKAKRAAYMREYTKSKPPTSEQKTKRAMYYTRPERRAHHKAYQKRVYAEKKQAGVCSSCSRPVLVEGGTQCEYHWYSTVAFRHFGDGGKAMTTTLMTLMARQAHRCPYTGVALLPGVNASLDHIMPTSRFPELGRDVTNVQWTSKIANQAKSALTGDEFVQLCEIVIAHCQYSSMKAG